MSITRSLGTEVEEHDSGKAKLVPFLFRDIAPCIGVFLACTINADDPLWHRIKTIIKAIPVIIELNQSLALRDKIRLYNLMYEYMYKYGYLNHPKCHELYEYLKKTKTRNRQ
ncbi:hypothetical protein J4526_00750 [Desulfurococcaceae archaeon MEX13E-LK6-19]|nr:hypothetical protein J4526_00750 [Desulfurococcaceae archaeon MEX13E-LK6-19]